MNRILELLRELTEALKQDLTDEERELIIDELETLTDRLSGNAPQGRKR